MKVSANSALIKLTVLTAGGTGLLIRALLYATATDAKGLLSRNHPLSILLTALSIIVVAGIFLLTRPIHGPKTYADSFHPSIPGGLGCMLASAGILLTTINELSAPADPVSLLLRGAGFLAAACLLVAGACRMMGSRGPFLFYAMASLYFCLRMVCQYRLWSDIPQLQDYAFQLLACMTLMLTAYHHAAFGADMGRHKSLWFFGLTSVYLCCLCLAGPENQLFFLGTGIWALADLSNLTPRLRRQRPNLHLEEQDSEEV